VERQAWGSAGFVKDCISFLAAELHFWILEKSSLRTNKKSHFSDGYFLISKYVTFALLKVYVFKNIVLKT
jgi:hypothetical protein